MFNSYIILLLTFIISILGSFLYSKIINSELSISYGFISGFFNTLLWILLIKNSKSTLITLSAWFDVIAALGYFTGFILMGNSINYIQIIGISFLLIGLYLIN